ncbi:MAG TPA: response regulator [Phycisphaerales bacterium]|nr:response regulator [Phycisphaerales bacterium]
MTTSPQNNPVTLVIADDEAPIRMVVGDKLRSAGIVVHEARDGEEALELVRTHLPVALVTDLQMPCMNGLELCLALRASPRTAHIPAVLLTARGHVLSDDMLARTSIKRVMSKPFGVRELLTYVQETLIPAGLAARAHEPAATR